jgi:AraC-like DNA-binding protein/hemin uptake protein HemP
VHEHVVGRVSARLAPFVSSLQGYRIEGLPAGTHVGMPSRSLTLVLSMSNPLEMSVPGVSSRVSLASVLGGLDDEPVLIHHDGNQYGLQLALTPAGARLLLGVPSGELAARVVDLEDLLRDEGRRLRERLVELGTWPERLDLVTTFLERRLERAERSTRLEPRPEVAEAWRLLSRRDGSIPISQVAAHVGWSTRHLGGRFRAEYGLAPKTVARVMRFERSRHLVQLGRSLAEVAAVCGYADQAHLTREWRSIAGVTPSRWLFDDVLANLQDDEAEVAAG